MPAVEMPRSEYMATRDASDDVSVRCARTRSRGLFNATSLYIALRESSEYVAATCVPWLRINVVIFRQSRGESPVSSLLVKWPRIFLIVFWLPTQGKGFFNMIYMYHWIYTCFCLIFSSQKMNLIAIRFIEILATIYVGPKDAIPCCEEQSVTKIANKKLYLRATF